VDAATQLIAAVEVVNAGSDMNQMAPMHAQIEQRYDCTPEHWLADGGFTKLQAIEQLTAQGTQPLVPPPKSRNPAIDPFAPKSTDSEPLAQWRARMASAEGQALYKQRGATVECANAQLRRRGLHQFNVRGLVKVRAVLLWHALAHNLMRMQRLNIAFQA
jgi:Transposase DDE domain